MRRPYFFSLFLLAAPWQLAAAPTLDQQIRVELSVRETISPIYLAGFRVKQTNGKISSVGRPHYITQLESILETDFQRAARTRVLPRQELKETLLQGEKEGAFDSKSWRDAGATHVIQCQILDDKLTATVFTPETGSLKHFPPMTLTGELIRDRRQLHKLADSIYRALFNEEGVASAKILYSLQPRNQSNNPDEWKAEIWECDWDGAGVRQLTHDGSYNITPVFVPNMSGTLPDRYLYVSYKMGQPKIMFATFKDQVGHNLIRLRGNQFLPAISPKLDKIAFISDISGRADLFIQNFHPEQGLVGKPIQLYSYPNATQASPTFSPDGRKVAFVSDRDGSPRIFVISAESSGRRQEPTLITRENNENSCPAWSPDGKKIAYSAKIDGVRQIWVYDFETHQERQVSFGAGNKENPSWAPNSCHIVFNSCDEHESELYVVNLNKTEVVKISKGSGKKQYPSWGMPKR